MANQERGGHRLNVQAESPGIGRTAVADRVSTSDAPTVAPSIPRPEVKVEPKPQRVNKKARMALAGLAIVGTVETTGAIITEQTNNQPLSTNTIPADLAWPWNLGRSAVEDIQGLLSKESPVSPIFDSKADNVVIKAGVNAVQATNEDLARIQDNITPPPSPKEENGLPALPQFTLLTPFILRDGDQISMSKRYNGPGIETATGKIVEPRWAGTFKFIANNKDTEMIPGIIDPKAISMELFKNKPFTVEGKEYFGGVKLRVTRQDKSQYQVSYYSTEDVRSLIPLSVLDDAPQANSDYKSWLSQKGLLITGITPMMKTDIANAPINVVISRISSSRSVNDLFFSEIQLFQSPDSKALLAPSQP